MKKKPHLSAFLSLILLSMLLTFCLAASAPTELVWDIQVVDEEGSGIGNGYCPIVVDADNKPHIAYSGASGVSYASWNGSGWSIQQIESVFAYDLALDANGNPHITSGSLSYARWTGTGWNIQTVTTNHTLYSSLALDSAGNPHAAYITGKELQYAIQNGSKWAIQTVTVDDNLLDIDPMLSLAIDSNDTPYIMYCTRSSYINSSIGGARFVNVKLAVWKNSIWNIETVPASSNLGEFGNMVLDSNGYPHFIAAQRHYLSAENPILISTILHVSWNGSAWKIQTVASNVTLANIGFLALGPDDNPHIVYNSGQLMYTRWTGKTWETQNVTTTSLASQTPTLYLAVDSNGNPHISYINGDVIAPYIRRELMYATANATKPTEDTRTSSDCPLLIVSSAIIIGTVITVTAYVWNKKRKH